MTGFEIGVLILMLVVVSALRGILSRLGEVSENLAKLSSYTREIVNTLREAKNVRVLDDD